MCFYHFTLLPDRLPHFLPHHLPTLCPLLFVLWTTHQISLCCPYTHCCGATYWSVVNLPRVTPLKETDSFFPRSCQLSIAAQLGVGAHEPLPNQCWMLIGWILSGSSVGNQGKQSASITSRRHCFVWILPNIQLLESFRPIFHNGPWALGEAYDIDVQFVAGNSAGTVWGLCWLCVYRDMTVEGSLIVCLFDRAVVGFSLGPMSSSALVLGQICSTRLMFPFVEQV